MTNVCSVLILGGGSAGFITAITLKAKLPSLQVTVVRSKEIGIIGVGEGSIPLLPQHLHGYMGLDLKRFYDETRPTWKLGIRFLWGPRKRFHFTFRSQCDMRYQVLSRNTGYYYEDEMGDGEVTSSLLDMDKAFEREPGGGPRIGLDSSYHLENTTFVAFLEKYALEMGIHIVDDTVRHVEQNEQGISRLQLASGQQASADLYVDASGFRSLLLGQTLQEPFRSFASSLYCDTAVHGYWQRGADEPVKPYTTAETMDAGWCWQIEHEHHMTRGYVHSSAFISPEDAERELRAKNPKIGETKWVKFRSGRYERAWVKNVVAVGNACGFVEPLESTALGMVCANSQAITEILREDHGRVTPSHLWCYNQRCARGWDTIRNFLATHYKFNTRLQTPFWKACVADVDLAGAAPIVEYYQQNGPSSLWRHALIDQIDQFGYEGYLAMLVGQRVPYQTSFRISDSERETFRKIQQQNRQRASQGFSVAEALEIVQRPEWRWDPNFFKQVYAPS